MPRQTSAQELLQQGLEAKAAALQDFRCQAMERSSPLVMTNIAIENGHEDTELSP